MADIKDRENAIIMETTKGRVVMELFPDLAPGHVARIKELAREGAYDGVVFHRVIDGFMAQTGENMAMRQLLGHERLPVYVGDIDGKAPYRPEQQI